MAINIVLGLSNSPSLNHCRRNFSTAINRTRLVISRATNQHSTTCSDRLIISPVLLRQFSISTCLVSDNMKPSIPEDLVVIVKHLKTDVDLLRQEIKLLRKEVKSICNIGGRLLLDKDIDNTDKSILNDNATEKISAMATDFNTKIVTSQDNIDKATTENKQKNETDQGNDEMIPFSEATAIHYNKEIVISQDNNKAVKEKMSDCSEKSDTQGNIEEGTEKMSDFSQTMASDTVGYETAPIGKEQEEPLLRNTGYLLAEIESEISQIVDLLQAGLPHQLPDDSPVDNDVPGVASITLKGQQYYNLENMAVTVHKPSVFNKIKNCMHSGGKRCYKMPLTVEIKIVYHTGFYIENDYGSDNTKGLLVRELNDGLQKKFKKYLKRRGITSGITNIIFDYMLDKLNIEKMVFLNNLKKTIEA